MRLSLLALVPLTASLAVTSAPVAATGETCDGRPATIVAQRGRPTRGTEGDDVIVGTEGPDHVDALGGNDVVCGLGGADELRGGSGDDRLSGGLNGRDENWRYLADLIVPGPGDDTIDVGFDPLASAPGPEDQGPGVDWVSWEDSPTGVTIDLATGTAVGEGSDTIVLTPAPMGVVGSPHSDTLTGTDRDEWFDTRAGDDVVVSGGGGDSVITQGGDDRVDAGDGDDWVVVGRGADEVDTGPGADSVWVQRGAAGAQVRTGSGRDRVNMSGSAEIDTGIGRDYVLMVLRPGDRFAIGGGTGRDDLDVVPRGYADARMTWDNARGRVRTSAGLVGRTSGFERLILADGVRWTFLGADFGERVRANAMADAVLMRGGGGADVLWGTENDDVLDGGTGRDVLRGDAGRDLCRAGEVVRGCEPRG